jgi:hypothetical protein
MNVRSIGVAAVFLVGCAVGGVSSQLAVPKATAQQAAKLTRWEYRCESPGTNEEAPAEMANRFGAVGFELATVRAGFAPSVLDLYCFKRPKM